MLKETRPVSAAKDVSQSEIIYLVPWFKEG